MERRLFGKRLQSHGKRELCLGGVVREWIMSGRVYSLTHTAAANTHTWMKKWMFKNVQRNLQKQQLFLSETQNMNNSEFKSHKANKHSCFIQNRGHTHRHTCYHKVSYHTNCAWLNSRGGKGMSVCFCVCSFLDRASLYDTKPGFLSSKIQCHLPLQRPGLFVPSHLDQHRGSSVAPKGTILPFLRITYIPTLFPWAKETHSYPKGLFSSFNL